MFHQNSIPISDAVICLQTTMEHSKKGMCSPPDSIPLLQMLVRLTNAQKVVEVGVFTGKLIFTGRTVLAGCCTLA